MADQDQEGAHWTASELDAIVADYFIMLGDELARKPYVKSSHEAFGESNGALSLKEMRARIAKYRKAGIDDRSDFQVGCRILTRPFFLDEPRWIPVPQSWSSNIVSFKGYSTDERDGRLLWDAVQIALAATPNPNEMSDHEQARYGEPTLVRPRLGQGHSGFL